MHNHYLASQHPKGELNTITNLLSYSRGPALANPTHSSSMNLPTGN
jgi:hypothetical protein